MIDWSCSNCNEVLEAPASAAGMELACPTCTAMNTVPQMPSTHTQTPVTDKRAAGLRAGLFSHGHGWVTALSTVVIACTTVLTLYFSFGGSLWFGNSMKIVDGKVMLPEQAVAGVRLYDVVVTREAEYMVVSGMVVSDADVKLRQHAGASRLMMDDGRQVRANSGRLAGAKWYGHHEVQMRKDIAVSVQWRFAIGSQDMKVQLMELWLSAKSDDFAPYRDVPIPQ